MVFKSVGWRTNEIFDECTNFNILPDGGPRLNCWFYQEYRGVWVQNSAPTGPPGEDKARSKTFILLSSNLNISVIEKFLKVIRDKKIPCGFKPTDGIIHAEVIVIAQNGDFSDEELASLGDVKIVRLPDPSPEKITDEIASEIREKLEKTFE